MTNEMRKLMESVASMDELVHRSPKPQYLTLQFIDSNVMTIDEYHNMFSNIEQHTVIISEHDVWFDYNTRPPGIPGQWSDYDLEVQAFYSMLVHVRDRIEEDDFIDFEIAGYALVCEDLDSVKLFSGQPPEKLLPHRDIVSKLDSYYR